MGGRRQWRRHGWPPDGPSLIDTGGGRGLGQPGNGGGDAGGDGGKGGDGGQGTDQIPGLQHGAGAGGWGGGIGGPLTGALGGGGGGGGAQGASLYHEGAVYKPCSDSISRLPYNQMSEGNGEGGQGGAGNQDGQGGQGGAGSPGGSGAARISWSG